MDQPCSQRRKQNNSQRKQHGGNENIGERNAENAEHRFGTGPVISAGKQCAKNPFQSMEGAEGIHVAMTPKIMVRMPVTIINAFYKNILLQTQKEIN